MWGTGAITFVSKEGSEIDGKGVKMRKYVVHDEDDSAMWVVGIGLPDGRVVEAAVVPYIDIMLGAPRLDMLGAWVARMWN
jgi:hypothetical protein